MAAMSNETPAIQEGQSNGPRPTPVHENSNEVKRCQQDSSDWNRMAVDTQSYQGNSETKPPDGGLHAWMAVASGFFAIMNTWGVFVSFGVFQSYYVTTLQLDPSKIAWIGSFEIFLLFFLGIVTARLTDAGYFRLLLLSGAFMTTLGTFVASICHTYWQLFLAQGVCVGLGNGLLFAPTMAVLSTYFQRKRALALGISACGSVTGGLIFPSMARRLLPTIGFGWTMRAIGFIQLGTLSISIAFIKTRVTPGPLSSLIDWPAFKEIEYSLFAIGCLLTYTGAFVPFFFLITYARDIQGLSYSESLNLLLVLNGIGILGRLFPSYLADRLGMLNVFTAMVFLGSLAMYTWIAVSSVTGLYVWTIFYSLFFGGIQSLSPAALTSLNSDLQKQGTRMGMNFGVLSFGALVGTPVAGALISGNNGSYVGAQSFAASCMAAGAVCFAIAREYKRGKTTGNIWMKL
ncbi:riboflavin transporter MCH5 [Dendryphion nanum]|uniref:Riboflavin transporter MCH5 n=1 Tax=Dendryphion nanum TaxID=256645 RepID=A0A9P9E1C9_9PLEO|nr:riboflavin transporter MCH5 [Dendryphion nanum]